MIKEKEFKKDLKSYREGSCIIIQVYVYKKKIVCKVQERVKE